MIDAKTRTTYELSVIIFRTLISNNSELQKSIMTNARDILEVVRVSDVL